MIWNSGKKIFKFCVIQENPIRPSIRYNLTTTDCVTFSVCSGKKYTKYYAVYVKNVFPPILRFWGQFSIKVSLVVCL